MILMTLFPYRERSRDSLPPVHSADARMSFKWGSTMLALIACAMAPIPFVSLSITTFFYLSSNRCNRFSFSTDEESGKLARSRRWSSTVSREHHFIYPPHFRFLCTHHKPFRTALHIPHMHQIEFCNVSRRFFITPYIILVVIFTCRSCIDK